MALMLPKPGTAESTPYGTYVFRLIQMELVDGKDWDTDEVVPNSRMKWVFKIEKVISGDAKARAQVGREHWEFTSLKMGAKANMRKWSEGLLGRQIGRDEEIDAETQLLQRAGLATIGDVYDSKGKMVRVGLTNLAPYIEDDAPASASSPAPTPAAIDPNNLPEYTRQVLELARGYGWTTPEQRALYTRLFPAAAGPTGTTSLLALSPEQCEEVCQYLIAWRQAVDAGAPGDLKAMSLQELQTAVLTADDLPF